MFRLRKLYEEIRVRERSGQELRSIPLARFVLAILGLIGLEILLVLWLYELPQRSPYFQGGSGLLAPSILLTHPKGPLCLLLFLVAVAIATVCRDLAHLTGNRARRSTTEGGSDATVIEPRVCPGRGRRRDDLSDADGLGRIAVWLRHPPG